MEVKKVEQKSMKFFNEGKGTTSTTKSNSSLNFVQKKEEELEDSSVSSTSPCSSCRQLSGPGNWDTFLVEETDVLETHELGEMSTVKCISCHQFIGLLNQDLSFQPMSSILESCNAQGMSDGWQKVETIWERKLLFILSQVIYNQLEKPDESLMEVEFAFPPSSDFTKLLWVNQQPVGFYSVKLKGTLTDLYFMQPQAITTLDTIFIRKGWRGRGWGPSAIKDLVLEFPHQNLGFSFPISVPMRQVLRKYLDANPSDRPRFWEVTGCGSEGNMRNIWLLLQRETLPDFHRN